MKIHPSSIVFALTLVVLDKSVMCLIPFAAALCHELGHIAAMRICKVRAQAFELTPFGARIDVPEFNTGTIGALAVLASGPIANIVSAILLSPLGDSPGGGLFCGCSISLAVINLLPVHSLDGGQIAEVILYRIAPLHAHKLMGTLSAGTLFLVWVAAVYLLLVFDGNISLMLFCGYLFVTLFLHKESAV